MANCRTSPSRFRLQQRDIELLTEIYSQRLLSRDQIITLGYFNSVSRCNDRLKKLRTERLIATVSHPLGATGSPSIYRITARAARLVGRQAGLSAEEVQANCGSPSPFLTEHTLRITDVRLSLECFCREHGFVIDRWLPELYCRHEYKVVAGQQRRRVIVKPDAFCKLAIGLSMACFFIEVDLGHVSRKRFQQKLLIYRDYSQEIFQQTYREKRFSVLVVSTGIRRMRNLQAVVPNGLHVFFSTPEDLPVNVLTLIEQATNLEAA